MSDKPTALKNVRNCQHIKVTGLQCESPAMRGEQFCYFHQRMFRSVKTPPNARLHPIALIEDGQAIQSSLMEVINALARNHIDLRRADLILKALRIAVKNSQSARFDMHEDRMVREVPDYPAPPKPAPPPISEEQRLAERGAENALLQLQAQALSTLVTPKAAPAAPAPVLVPVASATAKTEVKKQIAPSGTVTVDPSRRKPQSRAGMPSIKQAAVGRHKLQT